MGVLIFRLIRKITLRKNLFKRLMEILISFYNFLIRQCRLWNFRYIFESTHRFNISWICLKFSLLFLHFRKSCFLKHCLGVNIVRGSERFFEKVGRRLDERDWFYLVRLVLQVFTVCILVRRICSCCRRFFRMSWWSDEASFSNIILFRCIR